MSDRVLEVDDAGLVEADEWAALEPKAAPLNVSAELERQVAEFLANGGCIKEFEPGETAIAPNQPLWSFPVGKASELASPTLRAQAQSRRAKAQSASQRNGTQTIRKTKHSDVELVRLMGTLFGVAKTKKELFDALGCSDSLLQRLLFTYFPDDKRADKYRAISRGDKERQRLVLVRKCLSEGHTGTQNIANLLGVRLEVVLELDAKYGLKIPRQAPGRKGRIACTNSMCHAMVTTTAKYCPQCGAITAVGAKKGVTA